MSDSVSIRSPWDGSEVGSVARPSGEDVERAIAAASAAFAETSRLPTYRREEILRGVASRLEARQDELARGIAREAGKPLKAARTEVQRAVTTFHAAAAEAGRRAGDVLPLDVNSGSLGRWGVVRRFPLGPVCAITPFNFPLNLVAHKVAPAIAVGAPVVQKPASQTPLSSMALRELVLDAGWPSDAYAVLTLSGAAAERLVTDPRLPVVSFTGSPLVGWRLKELAPRKRIALELGGNAAAVVCADADLLDAASRIVTGAFSYAGQSCISLQRTFVHRSVFDELSRLVVEKTAALRLGDPLDETTDIGPMITRDDALRALSWVDEAVAQGARLLCGGTVDGSVMSATVLTATSAAMKVECEEVFAPIVTLAPYDDFEDALRRVNESRFGLQAGLFTRDLAAITRAFETLEVGALIVNDVPTWRADRMPYGGVKGSGIGREGPAYAMEEFTEPRLLVMRA